MEKIDKDQEQTIDIVRAALCALSYQSSESFQSVHINRIKACAERLGLEEDLGPHLDILELLREAQHLGKGYWVPTPPRTVRLEGCALIVAPNPTVELKRCLHSSITIAGYGRVMESATPIPLPAQDYDDWIGAPLDLAHWTNQLMARARAELKPTVHPEGRVEIYAPWISKQRVGGGFFLRWRRLDDCGFGDIDAMSLLLCRTNTATGRRWFLATVSDHRVATEYEIQQDRLRLLYGLNLINGVRTFIKLENQGSSYKIVPRMPIPKEERRLLLALAHERMQGTFTSYEFDARFKREIETVLLRLGIKLR